MEKHNGPFVPPEAGPGLFRRMREAVDRGDTSEAPPAVGKPLQSTTLKTKKPESESGNGPASENTLNFRNGSSAMDDWQKEKEELEEKRLDRAA